MIYTNLYEYDFVACSYSILKNINYDLSDINYKDKKLRNIQIGLLQRDNKILKLFLNDEIKKILDFYIHENKLKPDEIIWRQKDGLIVTRYLQYSNISMEILLRNKIDKLIRSLDGKKILFFYNDGRIIVKGINNKPIDYTFYDLLLKLNFYNKKKLLEGLSDIRNRVLIGDNINWYIRKTKDGLIIPTINNGMLRVSESIKDIIDMDSIDRKFIWDNYMWPFVQPLMYYNC